MTSQPRATSNHPDPEALCPACLSTSLSDLGPIYHSEDPPRVAGIPVNFGGLSFSMKNCKRCSFQFKFPHVPEQLLLDCYAAAEGDHWGMDVDPLERNFDRIKTAIERQVSSGRILDIGCFNGAFLQYLGPQWTRFGVEPSVHAAAIAEQRGVTVLGSTIASIERGMQFDVVTAVDVLEHILEPRPFFEAVARLLSPNGIFVVSTADTRSLSFRLQGPRYWYCSYVPEHVSFFSRRAIERLASHSGFQSLTHERMSHKRTSASVRLRQGLKGIAYSALLRAHWFGIERLRSKFARRAGTDWIAASDHMIHVMQRS
jgi:2-polyprenyl-3-methyl-5-hydroxy-6-metoxy-1,4-benzoquinol methylase